MLKTGTFQEKGIGDVLFLLPLVDDMNDTIVVGSIQELHDLSGEKVTDLHRETVDNIKIFFQGKTYKRIDDVMDCWFESGSMPYDDGILNSELIPAEFI